MLLTSIVNGVLTQAEINMRRAADGRHPPFITTFTLPEKHPALPEGTIMDADAGAGMAKPNTSGETTDIIGVLEARVAENQGYGNILIHGSCPAEILKWVAEGEITDATPEMIEALRGKTIYV
jgi:hypothetical protein